MNFLHGTEIKYILSIMIKLKKIFKIIIYHNNNKTKMKIYNMLTQINFKIGMQFIII